jgi:hypothetical protein
MQFNAKPSPHRRLCHPGCQWSPPLKSGSHTGRYSTGDIDHLFDVVWPEVEVNAIGRVTLTLAATLEYLSLIPALAYAHARRMQICRQDLLE